MQQTTEQNKIQRALLACNTLDDCLDKMDRFGTCENTDGRLVDGCDDPDDDYVMEKYYSLTTPKGNEYKVTITYGDLTEKVGCVEVECVNEDDNEDTFRVLVLTGSGAGCRNDSLQAFKDFVRRNTDKNGQRDGEGFSIGVESFGRQDLKDTFVAGARYHSLGWEDRLILVNEDDIDKAVAYCRRHHVSF